MSINRPERFTPGHPVHQPYPYIGPSQRQCPSGQFCPLSQPVPNAPGLGPCPSGNPYTVRPGDSLPGIASRLGIPVDRVTALNPNTNSQGPLPVGQTLCLP